KAEGSIVGSLEFCTGKLGSRLVLVLGHTKCGAVYGATKTFLDAQGFSKKPGSALQGLLQDLGVVAQQAQEEMGPGANADAIAAHAVQVNVFHTMNFLLSFSESIREAVRSGQIEIHGGIYDLETGSVEFLGKSPQQAQLLESSMPVPPSMSSGAAADHGMHGVRTGADVAVKPEAALKLLKQGNERFAALVKCGQAPHSAILGCADLRVPVNTVFDAMPGDLFVLRNAGNTCTHAEGSIVGSLEFCTGKLGAQLVLVLGHTQCVAGQAELLSSKRSVPPSIQCATIRTAQSEPVMPQDALAMLKDGNKRFAVGAPTAGKVHQSMRADLNNMGQAPHTALLFCADSRVPLETVFDALPGDLFVLRNGSVLGSLEFCTGALNTRLIFVHGHTACGAIKGATKAYLDSKKSKSS
ncbi:mtcA2, partial [Symbiodinium pilosum]